MVEADDKLKTVNNKTAQVTAQCNNPKWFSVTPNGYHEIQWFSRVQIA